MTNDEKKLAYRLADELAMNGYGVHSVVLRTAIDEIKQLEKMLTVAGTRTNKFKKKLEELEKAHGIV